MAKNITSAVQKGEVSELMSTCANHFLYITMGMQEETTAAFNPNPYIEANGYYLPSGGVCKLITLDKNTHFQFQCYLASDIQNEYFEYHATENVCYCSLINPENAGINAIKLTKLPGVRMPRIFIVSGRLTGCAFAVLQKGNSVYALHVGKAGGEACYSINKKCADICKIMQNLTGMNFWNPPEKIDVGELLMMLQVCGITGKLYFNDCDLKYDIETMELSFESYKNNRNYKDKSREGTIKEHDVIFLQNEGGRSDIACRGIVIASDKGSPQFIASPVHTKSQICTLL